MDDGGEHGLGRQVRRLLVQDCAAFEAVARVRGPCGRPPGADRLGIACNPEQFAIRRNISIAPSEAEARERPQKVARKILAGDLRRRFAHIGRNMYARRGSVNF